MYSTQGPRLREGEARSRGARHDGCAPWGPRALAALVDTLLLLPFEILHRLVEAHKDSSGLYSGTADGATVASALLTVAAMAVFFWNVVVKQGGTGQTVGKEMLKIKLLDESTGQPIGKGRVFLRQMAHILDALPVCLGYLWPLWDPKRQTFADKLAQTVVVRA